MARPKGSLSNKYKDNNGNPIGVYEWRRFFKPRKSFLKTPKIKYDKSGRPKGSLKGYKNNDGNSIGVIEWRKNSIEWKQKRKEYNLKNKEEILRNRVLKYYNLTLEEYKTLTSKCALCGYNLYPSDLHHKDGNKKNNNKENQIGLCSNCHLGMHRGHIKNPYAQTIV